MSDWLHSLPVLWMAVLVFGFTYLITAGIHAVRTVLAVGERARSFKAISPGLLPPLGIIFGLFVVFTAAQVWTDNEKARAEIDREASALRSAAILATSFATEYQVQLRELVRRYIADVVAQEWPMMARGTANLRAIPGVLAEALQATLALNPSGERSEEHTSELQSRSDLVCRLLLEKKSTCNCICIHLGAVACTP